MSGPGRAKEGGIDGILVLAKPSGPTSHDMVGLVRRLSGTHRVGHGGTLDPFASGVLPVFLGLGTRVVEYHMRDDKAYRATVCYGASSSTDDRDGELAPGNRDALEGRRDRAELRTGREVDDGELGSGRDGHMTAGSIARDDRAAE